MTSPEPGPKKVSLALLQVLQLLVSQPTKDDWYGLLIGRETGLGSGTITQILFRLEQWGWVEPRWEGALAAHADGRPPRRFYKLTGTGEAAARELIRQRQHRTARWQAHGGLA